MLLSEIIAEYSKHLPVGIVLEDSQIIRNLRKAVRLYCGYATLKYAPSEAELYVLSITDLGLCAPLLPIGDVHSPVNADDAIPAGQDFKLTASELAIIQPLWTLYNEWENAQSLEASRSQGLEVYGRTTGEIAMDIREREQGMADVCFMEPVVSI